MPSYQFPKERAEAIASGRQTFALQAPRKKGSPRHVEPTETITLRPGGRTIGQARCVARATIHIDRDGLRRVVLTDEQLGSRALDRFLNAENGSANAAAECEAIARDLGYDSWRDLFNDHNTQELGPGKVSRGVLAREVICWDPAGLQDEKAAA